MTDPLRTAAQAVIAKHDSLGLDESRPMVEEVNALRAVLALPTDAELLAKPFEFEGNRRTQPAATPAGQTQPVASEPITSAVLSIKGAERANLSPKAVELLQRGADALSLEVRQSRAQKVASIANIPLASPPAGDAIPISASGDEPALSDERLQAIRQAVESWGGNEFDFARAVIAADRAARQPPAAPAGDQGELPSALDYSAKRQMAVTKEWCRGWDDARAALASRARVEVAVPDGFWLAPMEPDEAMTNYKPSMVHPRIMAAIYGAMRDSWLARHPTTQEVAVPVDVQRDAERYRKLRDGDDESVIDSIYPFSIWENTHWLKRGEALDKAIDAARKQGEQQ